MRRARFSLATAKVLRAVGLPDAGLIEFRAKGRQTGFDVAQTFAPSQLGEGGAIIVHQVKNRSNAGSHPQGIVAELKSKKLKQ
ncbi:MAG: hypothetical protein WCJ07_02155 [Verrucomicrobiota bacterium]